eukprot:scaffold62109_cov54-Phaeocystis_antarctica.AAC.7
MAAAGRPARRPSATTARSPPRLAPLARLGAAARPPSQGATGPGPPSNAISAAFCSKTALTSADLAPPLIVPPLTASSKVSTSAMHRSFVDKPVRMAVSFSAVSSRSLDFRVSHTSASTEGRTAFGIWCSYRAVRIPAPSFTRANTPAACS